jgi:uncharacterized SAM-binding protein YcdF (DUF218 family)
MLRRVSLVFGGLVVLALILWLARAPILRGLAHAWVVDEGPAKADAILVPGGGVNNRPFAAAELHAKGYAPKILILDVKASATAELGLVPTEETLTRGILEKKAVPAQAIERIGKQVTSSGEEAAALRDWVKSSGAKRILVTTDPFHTRRLAWLLRKELADTDATLIFTPAPNGKCGPDNWWQHEAGLIDFQNEVVKYLFYRVKH